MTICVKKNNYLLVFLDKKQILLVFKTNNVSCEDNIMLDNSFQIYVYNKNDQICASNTIKK